FCAAPLPKECHRMVMYTSAEIAALKADDDAKWWLGVDLAAQEEIPVTVGHRLVYPGIPETCEKCKSGKMQMTQRWLEIKCDHCGQTERHTPLADATWVASWSEIHGYGHSPAALGRAYLATR